MGKRGQEKSNSGKSKLLCIAPFNNPHIVPFYEEVRACGVFDTTLVSLRPISEARKALGWKEMEEGGVWLQPWRSIKERFVYLKMLVCADIVLFPGIFHFWSLPFHHLVRRVISGRVILWSEPVLNHPRSKDEAWLKTFLRRVVLAPFNTRRYHFLSMGAGAELDYQKMGASKWDFRQFLFTVKPFDFAEPAPPQCGSQRRIVFSGSLVERKGVDLLLRALSIVNKREIPFLLTVVGDGPERDGLERLAQALELGKKVKFVGTRPIDEVVGILAEQDVLVLPSRFDGWGAVVNEAMESSLAVIVSDKVGSRRPLIKDGVNGYVFESGSQEDLSNKLIDAVSDERMLLQLRNRSRERIEKFRPSIVASEFVSFCEAIVSEVDFSPSGEVLKKL